MWDERYASDEYVYGTEPNDFLREQAHRLAGPVLSLAEGEGRNAVHLAGLGLDVLGVDGSAVGLAKARRLAASRGLHIATEVADLAGYTPAPGAFGGIISIFCHLPSPIRRELHRRVAAALKPGGLYLLEAYAPAQVGRGTGGPPDPDFCPTLASLRADFPGFEHVHARECLRPVLEGRMHTGEAAVVQFIARKPR